MSKFCSQSTCFSPVDDDKHCANLRQVKALGLYHLVNCLWWLYLLSRITDRGTWNWCSMLHNLSYANYIILESNQQRRRLTTKSRLRLQKHHFKSEFALLQTLCLFHLFQFVKCWQIFLELNSNWLNQGYSRPSSKVVFKIQNEYWGNW